MTLKKWARRLAGLAMLGLLQSSPAVAAEEPVLLVGLTYPNTGRHKTIGVDQARGALLAIEEINAEGGILGRQVKLKTGLTGRIGTEPPDFKHWKQQGMNMAFGGSLYPRKTATAAAEAELVYFDTLFHPPGGHISAATLFYQSYDAWMAAKTLAFYANQSYRGKNLIYLTSDSEWGRMTEQVLRKFTGTSDSQEYRQLLMPFPNASHRDMETALRQAMEARPEVLMLVLQGDRLAKALKLAYELGIKNTSTLMAPNIDLAVAREVGSDALEGVLATVPWSWQVARDFKYQAGIRFTEAYATLYKTHPSAPAASAYVSLWQYKQAVETAGTFEALKVSRALEGTHYTGVKDPQQWRMFDHLSIQSAYVVKGKPRSEVMAGALREDYFELVFNVPGQVIALTEKETRQQAWTH